MTCPPSTALIFRGKAHWLLHISFIRSRLNYTLIDCRHVWVTSGAHLNVHLNPSLLLSIGDLLAFWGALMEPLSLVGSTLTPQLSITGPLMARRLPPEAVPKMQDQMAQRGSITSRVPQKYLIQNQAGLRVYYWAGEVRVRITQDKGIQADSLALHGCLQETADIGAKRTYSLATGVSETLKVTPQRKVLSHVTVGKGGVGKVSNTINLHFEGNWMPIKVQLILPASTSDYASASVQTFNSLQDVAVSVVGKYRYYMFSPAEHDQAPVIVDIILVGRTKIITLHSGVWLENRMDRRLCFRLHIPISPLVAPSGPCPTPAAVQSTLSDRRDTTIGPLQPGEGEAVHHLPWSRRITDRRSLLYHTGTYLPVLSVLGGLLFVTPHGFREAQRDVIRLSPDIGELVAQEGHITCEPLPEADGGPSFHIPLHCSLLVHPAQARIPQSISCTACSACQLTFGGSCRSTLNSRRLSILRCWRRGS